MAMIGQNGDGGRWVEGECMTPSSLTNKSLVIQVLLSGGHHLSLVPAMILAISFIDSY